MRLLLEQKPRMSWEEYKEKHKDQLQDKMGMGVEREQARRSPLAPSFSGHGAGL